MAAPMIQRVTAWQTKEEWNIVYKNLFSDDSNQQQYAVDKMKVWRSRMKEKLSTGILCSLELTSAKLANMNKNIDSEVKTSSSAMALTRFVNLITDKKQTRLYATNIFKIAQEYGIPEWLVTIRHDSTHQHTPTLPMLEHAIDIALQWLKLNFWEEQFEDNHQENVEADNIGKEEMLKDLVENYIQLRLSALSESKAEAEDDGMELHRILDTLSKYAPWEMQCVTDLLGDYLLPTHHQLAQMGIRRNDFLAQNSLQLPQSLVEFWRLLLEVLQQHCVIALLEHFASLHLEVDSFSEKVMMGWIVHLLQEHMHGQGKNKSDMSVHQLITKLIKNPNQYTQTVLATAFKLRHDFTATQINDINTIVSLLYNKNKNNNQAEQDVTNSKIYTVADLPSDDFADSGSDVGESLSEIDCNVSKSRVNRPCSDWQLADEHVMWDRYPFGTCPAYTDIQSHTLELYEAYVSESPDTITETSKAMDEDSDNMDVEVDDEEGEGHMNGHVNLYEPLSQEELQRLQSKLIKL